MYLLLSYSSITRRDDWTCRGNGEHDPEADNDHRGNSEPNTWDLLKNARLPQGERGPEQQDEISDEIELEESHAPGSAGTMPGGIGVACPP
jgi:hypothetical protein